MFASQTSKSFMVVGAAGAALAIAGIPVLAQDRISPDAIPIEQEPQHVIELENDFVRVIDATLPPGYVTKDHIHAVDSVAVQVANGRTGADALRIGRASFSRGGYSHVVTNNNPAIVRYILVEPTRADRPGATATMLPNHELETENERVRVYRVSLPAGASMPSHSHASGWVEVAIAGSDDVGAFVWSAAGDDRPLRAPTDGPLEIVEIEPR